MWLDVSTCNRGIHNAKYIAYGWMKKKYMDFIKPDNDIKISVEYFEHQRKGRFDIQAHVTDVLHAFVHVCNRLPK